MSEYTDEERPLAQDDDQESHLRAKATLQVLVDDLARHGSGRSVTELQQRLEEAIAEAGLPEQPHPWVQSVAEHAATGHRTVLDARFADDGREGD